MAIESEDDAFIEATVEASWNCGGALAFCRDKPACSDTSSTTSSTETQACKFWVDDNFIKDDWRAFCATATNDRSYVEDTVIDTANSLCDYIEHEAKGVICGPSFAQQTLWSNQASLSCGPDAGPGTSMTMFQWDGSVGTALTCTSAGVVINAPFACEHAQEGLACVVYPNGGGLAHDLVPGPLGGV